MDIQKTRRQKLADLIRDKYGSQAEFVAHTGENQGEVSALLKSKSFGEKKARKIEAKCGLPPGWLDGEADAADGGASQPAAIEAKVPNSAYDDQKFAEQIIDLITAFKSADADSREWLVRSAKIAAKRSTTKRGKSTAN